MSDIDPKIYGWLNILYSIINPDMYDELKILKINFFFSNSRKYINDTIRDGIFKLLRSPGIDSKESIPPAYVAWRVDTTTIFLLGSYPP